MKTIQDVIDAEVTFSIEHLVLGCLFAKLGDRQNGYTASKTCESLEEAERFIVDAANKRVASLRSPNEPKRYV